MKKLLSVVLCLILLVGLVPAWAQTPAATALYGRRTLFIPETGAATYSYRGVVLDAHGSELPGYAVSVLPASDLPAGVSFDTESQSLVVTAEAPVGAAVSLRVAAAAGVPDVTETILLTKNLLANGDFSDLPTFSGWEAAGGEVWEDEQTGLCLKTETGTTVSPEETVTLEEGRLYVLRCKVRSDSEYWPGYARGVNSTFEEDGVLNFYIADISGGSWFETFVAVRPQRTGVYSLCITLSSDTQRPVYLDDIILCEEEPAAAAIEISGPSAFHLPKNQTGVFPFQAVAVDQEGNPLDEALTFSISPEGHGVTVDSEAMAIVVEETAAVETYRLLATCQSNPGVQGVYNIMATTEGIDDGTFDKREVGQSWQAIPAAELSIGSRFGNTTSPDGSQFARLSFNDTAAIMYNNSYVSFEAGKSYVFRLTLKKRVPDLPTAVTLFISDVYNTDFDSSMLAAYCEVEAEWKSYNIIFTPDRDVLGRLMLASAVGSDLTDQQLYVDNIDVASAYVFAKNVRIYGDARVGGTLTYSYEFVNNFDSEDQSVATWLIASTKDGEYVPIGAVNQQELDLIEELEGKYIKLALSPVSLSSGLIGETVESDPVYIAAKPRPSVPTGSGDEDEPESPPEPTPTPKPVFQPLSVSGLIGENTFTDMADHWARAEVAKMSQAGIIEGISPSLFQPEGQITKAELCAFLVRAFRLPLEPVSNQFADVAAESWYAPYVQTAFHYGLVTGVNDELFAPEATLNREQTALYFMQAYKKAGGTFGELVPLSYRDSGAVGGYAVTAVRQATTVGIVKGDDTGYFHPKAPVSRAEAATMLYRLLCCFEKEA